MNRLEVLAYEKRFIRVTNYINSQLSENLKLDELCQVANFSKYHFHRQFSEYFGVSVFRYIQLLRLKRASYQLAFRKQLKITDIALTSGFENPESFTRAFKKFIGQTPSQFRDRPQWISWGEKYRPLKIGKFFKNFHPHSNRTVKIVHFPATNVAALEHSGAPETLGDSIRRFIDWRVANNFTPAKSATYNILHSDSDALQADEFRIDICCEITSSIAENSDGVVEKKIPGGRCAVLRHIGDDDALRDSFHYLYAEWLPQSGEELRDFPAFLRRVTLFPDVAAHQNVVDIYLALK